MTQQTPTLLRRLRSALAVALALGCTGLVGAHAAKAGCAAVSKVGHWSFLEPPAGSTGHPGIAALAVDRSMPNRLVESDGAVIRRSLDGGCTWTDVFSLTTTPGVDPAAGITQLAIGARQRGDASHAIYALAVDGITGVLAAEVPVTVIASHDDGKTWKVANPLTATSAVTSTPQCTTAFLAASASKEDVVYLSCNRQALGALAVDTVRCGKELYVSTDGGATWSPTSGHLATYGNCNENAPGYSSVNPLLVDPANFGVVFINGLDASATPWRTRIIRSTNNGASFNQVAKLDPYVSEFASSAIDAAALPGRPARFVAYGPRAVWASAGDAHTWKQLELPVPATEAPLMTGSTIAGRGVLTVRGTGVHFLESVSHDTCSRGDDPAYRTSLVYYYKQKQHAFSPAVVPPLPKGADFLDLQTPMWDGQAHESFYFVGTTHSNREPTSTDGTTCVYHPLIARYTP